MKLKHLCARHCEVVQQSAEQARHLWTGAYNNGVAAYQAEDWQRAESFLGTAFEIALVRFVRDVHHHERCLTPDLFAAVGRYYANVLCRKQSYDDAELCLRRVHDGLLHWSEAGQLNYQERISAFEQVGEFRQKLVALLELSGRETYAKCTELLAQQLAKQVATSLYH